MIAGDGLGKLFAQVTLSPVYHRDSHWITLDASQEHILQSSLLVWSKEDPFQWLIGLDGL